MQNFFRQNRNILVVALSVFIVSMTGLMFFLNNNDHDNTEMQTDVLHSNSESDIDPENEYRNMFESGSDPFAVMKLDGHITFTSAQFEVVTGFSSDDLQGRLFFSLIDGDDLPTFFSAFGKVIETGKAVTMIGPFGMADKAGDYRTSMGSVMPVMENGRVAKIGILIKDISEELENKKNPADEDAVVEDDAKEDAAVEVADEPETERTTTQKKFTNTKKLVKPADPKGTDPANEYQKPKNVREDDASWITGGKLVMNFPIKLPLFPAHLLLAGM